MRISQRVVSIILVVLLVSVLAAADTVSNATVLGNLDRPVSSPADSPQASEEELRAKWAAFPHGLSLSRDIFLTGQEVFFAFKNGTDEIVEIPGGAPWYIADEDGELVFTPMSTAILIYLQPGHGLDWSWNQKDNYDVQVKPGDYQLVLTTSAGESRKTFTVSGARPEKGQEVAPPELPTDRPFVDVDGSVGWGDAHILQLHRRGIVNGRSHGLFVPDGTLTRAEFVTMLLRAYDIEPLDTDAETPFTDLGLSQHWAYGYIARAHQLGLVTADDFNGRFGRTAEEIESDHRSHPYHAPFGPDDPITRLEMALIVGRALGENQSESIGDPGESQPVEFTDAGIITAAYERFVRTASEYGVLRGYDDGSFGPQRYTTRREACVVIYRLIGHAGGTITDLVRVVEKDGAGNETTSPESGKFSVSTGNIHDYMPRLLAGENVSDYELLPCLENFTIATWSELHEAYDNQSPEAPGHWWNALWLALRDAAIGENSPDNQDQQLRDYYIGKAQLASDGAYSEGLATIVMAQWDANPVLYSSSLNQVFSIEEAHALRQSIAYSIRYWHDSPFGIVKPIVENRAYPGGIYLGAYPVDFPFCFDLPEKSRETYRAESFGQVTVVESDDFQVTYLNPADGVYRIITLRAKDRPYRAEDVAITDTEEFLLGHFEPGNLRKVDRISYDDEAWFGTDYDYAYSYTPDENTRSLVYIIKDGLISGIEVVDGLDGPLY
ncbi:MAG: S-layer homology domain-containing protein [Bacillota bacterium]